MIVVADSAPLIALSKIGQFELLHALYGTLAIPRAVETEVVKVGANRSGSTEVRNANWITVHPIEDHATVNLLRQQLDIWESEAIALAIQLEATSLLIDEAKGRRIAQSQGIQVIGTVGSLILAKQKGLIEEVSPLLDQLQIVGFHMSSRLHKRAKALSSE